MLKHFPAGCIIYSHPHPLPSQAPFWGTKHSTREPGSPKGTGQMSAFLAELSSLLCPSSHPVSTLQTINTRPCTVVWMHKSPKPHTKLQPWKAPGLWPRSSLPLHPHPFPWACFQSLQRTAEPGTGSATTSSLLRLGLPSCGPHSHLKTWFPGTFLLESSTGCCGYKGESLSSSEPNSKIYEVNTSNATAHVLLEQRWAWDPTAC